MCFISKSLCEVCNVCVRPQVTVRINRGKDFSFNTVELTGETQPGAYIAFSGVDYDLYSHGGDIFLTEKDVSLRFYKVACVIIDDVIQGLGKGIGIQEKMGSKPSCFY